jgi:hypothetical protein
MGNMYIEVLLNCLIIFWTYLLLAHKIFVQIFILMNDLQPLPLHQDTCPVEQHCSKKTVRTKLSKQNCSNKTVRTKLLEQNCWNKTVGTKLFEQNCSNKTVRTILLFSCSEIVQALPVNPFLNASCASKKGWLAKNRSNTWAWRGPLNEIFYVGTNLCRNCRQNLEHFLKKESVEKLALEIFFAVQNNQEHSTGDSGPLCSYVCRQTSRYQQWPMNNIFFGLILLENITNFLMHSNSNQQFADVHNSPFSGRKINHLPGCQLSLYYAYSMRIRKILCKTNFFCRSRIFLSRSTLNYAVTPDCISTKVGTVVLSWERPQLCYMVCTLLCCASTPAGNKHWENGPWRRGIVVRLKNRRYRVRIPARE